LRQSLDAKYLADDLPFGLGPATRLPIRQTAEQDAFE
jgi:hypothetical protein